MCFGVRAFVQTKYALVNTHAFLHYFVGSYRYTFEKIFELFRFIVSV